MINDLINKYDGFIITKDYMMLKIKWNSFESKEYFIEKVNLLIDELDSYPQKIIYNGNEIILVV